MKIGVISDIHGNKDSLDAVLSAFDEQGVDVIVCLGDMIGYFHQSLEVLELIQQSDIISILGNHEAYLLGVLDCPADRWRRYNLDYVKKSISTRTLRWLEGLPTTFSINSGGLEIAFFHGSPWSPLVEYIYPDYEHFNRFCDLPHNIVVLGHTHYPLIKNTGALSVVNPGSCGLPRDGDRRAGAAILNLDEPLSIDLLRVDYAVDAFVATAEDQNVSNEALKKLKR